MCAVQQFPSKGFAEGVTLLDWVANEGIWQPRDSGLGTPKTFLLLPCTWHIKCNEVQKWFQELKFVPFPPLFVERGLQLHLAMSLVVPVGNMRAGRVALW